MNDRDIEVAATFAGVRFMPWWYAAASNSMRPLLAVTPSGIRYRVIRTRERAFTEIEAIDLRTAWQTVNIVFRFHGRWLTLMANVQTAARARAALQALAPAAALFTPRAQAVLHASG